MGSENMKITPTTIASHNNQTYYPKQNKEGLPKEVTIQKGPSIDIKGLEIAADKLEKVKAALKSFNEILKPTHLEFQMHDEAGRYFVKIVDDKTQEVIKQIPSEEFLKMISETSDQLGLLVDQRV
jgi:flagellar protein FlaG